MSVSYYTIVCSFQYLRTTMYERSRDIYTFIKKKNYAGINIIKSVGQSYGGRQVYKKKSMCG